MRILIFSNWFPPISSGSSYYASSLAQALVSKGHEVIVATLDWTEENKAVLPKSFPVYYLPVIRLPRSGLFYNVRNMGLAFIPGNVAKLKVIIQTHKIQIIHHVNHIFDSTFLTATAAESLHIPVVGSITTPIQNQNRLKQRIMTLVDRWSVGFFGVKRWHAIVSLDATVHRYVGDLYGPIVQKRSFIIPFGVRIESMDQYQHGQLPNSQKPQIVFVGHIHPFRNPVQLIRSMPIVLKQFPHAKLILAGRIDIEEPRRAAKQLGLDSNQVEFLGETPHQEVVKLIRSSWIFASWVTGPYPSLGTAPMEAMICGVPVINDLPENLFGPGTLKNGDNIVIVDSKNPKSIAENIIKLFADKELRTKIGSKGREFVLNHLNWRNIAVQLEKMYHDVLKTEHSDKDKLSFKAKKIYVDVAK